MLKMKLNSSLMVLLGTTFIATSCGGTGEIESPSVQEEFDIEVEKSPYYEISLDKNKYKENETVKFDFTFKSDLHDFNGIYFNETLISDSLSTSYKFVMPKKAVKISVNLTEKDDVLEDGKISWSGSNFTLIPTVSDQEYVFPINIKWNYTTIIKHSITILDESIIQNSVVSFKPTTKSGSNLINGGELVINGKGLKKGTTKIALSLKSGNTSDKGMIIKTFEVTDEIVLETMEETLKFNTSYIDSLDGLKVQLKDLDYVEGADKPRYIDGDFATMTDNKFTFDYVIGHRYNVYVYKRVGSREISYRLSESIGGGSSATGFNQYKDGILTFIEPNQTLEIAILGEN